MMAADVTRRGALAGTALGLAATVAAARADVPGLTEPRALLGTVRDGAVSLPPLHAASELEGPPPNGDAPARRVGIAVVGIGHLTMEQILPGLAQSKHVKLTALVSGERDKARAVGAQHGLGEAALYGYEDFDRLRDNPDVDAVYIVLPNAMHAEYTERAAKAGKHVLCEKPMANSVAEAERMVAACRDAKRLLMIAYRCQYEATNRAAIDIVRSKAIGQTRLIEAVNGQNDADNGQWRQNLAMAGGGSLPDVGLYCLNATRYLTGEEPVEVSARLTRPKDDRRFREIEDVVSFTLTFPSGVIASCMCGYSLHESRRFRVMGTEGFVQLDPAFGYDTITMQVGRREGMSNALTERRWAAKNQFATEMDHFAECVRSRRQPHTPGEEGLQDQRIMAAIYEAAAGGGVVRMAPVPGLDVFRGPAPEGA